MALDNYGTGIRSVTYTTDTDGKPKEVDPVHWTREDYFHNLQADEAGVSMEPFAGEAGKRRTRKRKPKPVAQETPAAVGDELITKATEKDLRKRGLK